jgi:hypothetical protein
LSGVGTPLEFAEKIGQSLSLKTEQIDELLLIDEDKEGYFVATLYPKKFLNKEQFRMICGLVKDLGGEGYLQGAKAWKVPGPMAKTSPKPISESVPKASVGSETSPRALLKISQSSELCIGALSEDEDIRALRGSCKKISSLYPVLVSPSGDVIDGFHRLKANPDWPRFTVEGVADPLQLARARLIANERRNVSPEEKSQLLREIHVYSGWDTKQMAEELGWGISTVYKYLPDDLKDPTKAAARALGGSDSVLPHRTDDGKAVSNETLKPQDMTEGQIREFLDSPKVKEVAASIQSPTSPTESIPSPSEFEESPTEPDETSEETTKGSSEPHHHKLEGTQVGEFHCTECNQDFFIDHISADKHRLTKVRSAPE